MTQAKSVPALGIELSTGNVALDRAFRIAMGDMLGNVRPYGGGLLAQDALCLMAGLSYPDPWTRDAAINTWNGAGLLIPEIMRNTLLSVLDRHDGGVRIGGQYWDAIIWATGAWAYYCYSGDREFLATAFTAIRNSLAHFEATEFNSERHLFRGAACYGDGIAAYDDAYLGNGGSGILDWPNAFPARRDPVGVGLPMMSLSTNCLYEHAYRVLGEMARELSEPVDADWTLKADCLRTAINTQLWNTTGGYYRYYLDPFGGCLSQEGLGHALALLFDIAERDQAESVLARQHLTNAGIPCVFPTFSRYAQADVDNLQDAADAATAGENWVLRADERSHARYGRHSGTVWPHIQGFWADAALRHGRADLFTQELTRLSTNIARDIQCAEIYHPDSGLPYGGIQEWGADGALRRWSSCYRQTWSATALLRMVLFGLCGMRFSPQGVRFTPYLPVGMTELRLRQLPYREAMIDLTIRKATGPAATRLNGQSIESPYLPAEVSGELHLTIEI
jgi:glycogen debranching enzyme